MPNPTAPAADADTGDARAAGSESTSTSLNSVADAVAEMERRDRERRASSKTAKAATPEDDGDEAEDDGDEDTRQVEKAKPEKKPAKQRAEAADEDEGDDEADDAGDDDGEGDDDIEARDDGEDADADAEADDEPAEKKPAREPKAPAKVKLSVEGKDIEATPEELSTYLSEAARERQQLAQGRQTVQQQMQQAAEHGRLLAEFAQALIGSEPDLQTAQNDPSRYLAEQALYRQRAQAVSALMQRNQAAAQQAQQQQQQAFAQFVQREQQALLKAVPDLADPTKLAAFSGRVSKVAQKYGFTAAEMAQAHDHRIYLMLADLHRLSDIDAGRAAVRKQLKSAPPIKAPEQRAALGQRNTNGLKDRSAKAQFMKSGRSMRDVRAFLAATDR